MRNGPTNWRKIGLLARLTLLTVPCVVVAGLSILYMQSRYAIDEAKIQQQEQLKEVSNSILPLLAASTMTHDFITTHLVMNTQITHRQAIRRIDWTFDDGITLVVTSANAKTSHVPEWFISRLGIHDATSNMQIPLSSTEYGSLDIQLTAAPVIERIWHQYIYMARAIVIAIAFVIVGLIVIMRSNLKALRMFSRAANAFSDGDFSARIVPQGAPEFQAAAQAYNDMAQHTQTLLLELAAKEDALSTQLRFVSQLLESAPDAVCFLDSAGMIASVNKAWEDFYQLERDQVIGKYPSRVITWDAEYSEHELQMVRTILATEKAQMYETMVRKKSNDIRTILVSRVVLHDADKSLSGILETIADLTQLKIAEKDAEIATLEKLRAQTASETKSQFIAHVSHEMRTPLTAIIGYSEILLEPDLSDDERISSAKTVLRTSGHLLQLINDLLDISKIEAGKLEVENVTTDILALLNEVESVVAVNARNKSIYFKIEVDPVLPASIVTDSLRLKQIILNLCSNAIKFTHNGGITLKVKNDIKTNKTIFSVTDTGIGIDDAQAKTLFCAFSQAEVSTARKYGGTGLGLFLSKKLSELLGGDLSMQSSPGKGSCFTVSIANDDKTKNDEPHSGNYITHEISSEQISSIKGSILLADDVEINRMLITRLLNKTSVDIDTACDGKEVLEMASRKKYDLILMDMQMPVMDGLQATVELRRSAFQGKIIAFTANASKEDKEKYRKAGCDGFAVKPINRDMFYQMLIDTL